MYADGAAPSVLGPDPHRHAALVLTSPHYGSSVHGQVTARAGHGVAKRDHRYSRDRANLAHVHPGALLDAFATILTACAGYLRPGGIAAITAGPWRRDGVLVDLPGAMTTAAAHAGLMPFERNVALLATLRDDQLVPPQLVLPARPRSATPAGQGRRCESSPTKTCSCCGSRDDRRPGTSQSRQRRRPPPRRAGRAGRVGTTHGLARRSPPPTCDRWPARSSPRPSICAQQLDNQRRSSPRGHQARPKGGC